jgi:uncharacterized protein
MFQWANMLIMKTTRDCNLRCKYCYIKNKDNFKVERLSFDLFKVIINIIIKDRIKAEMSEVNFSLIFHGGEPLLMDTEVLANMLDYAETEFNKYKISHDFGVQTNLTLLDEEKSLLFNKYSVSIGASFDGIGDGNKGRTKEFTQTKFENKFNLMLKNQNDFGFLSVVNKANFDNIQESVEYVKKEYGINSIKVNYAEDIFKMSNQKDNENSEIDGKLFWEKAWKPYIDSYIQNKENRARDNNTDQIIEKFVEDSFVIKTRTSKGNCGVKICGGGINIIELNPDGSLYFCGRYSEDDPVVYMGDIKGRDFLSLHQLKRYGDFAFEKHKILLEAGCDTCFAASICDFGCMAFHYSTYGTFGIKKYLVCPIFKNMYKYMLENQSEIVKTYYDLNKNKDGELKIILDGRDQGIRFKHNSILTRKLFDNYKLSTSLEQYDKEIGPHILVRGN